VSDAGLDERTAPGLVGDAVRAVFGLGRNTARMFRFEARDVARRAGRRVALLIACSAFAAAGLLLVLGGLSLVVERAFALPLWAGLFIVGAAALGAGAIGVRAALRRLGDGDLAFPETIAELTKDAEAFASRRESRP
jgi:putative superfamily III holin-X